MAREISKERGRQGEKRRERAEREREGDTNECVLRKDGLVLYLLTTPPPLSSHWGVLSISVGCGVAMEMREREREKEK